MRIRITTTVDVDPDAWALEYSLGNDNAEVREDVKGYYSQMIEENLSSRGLAKSPSGE